MDNVKNQQNHFLNNSIDRLNKSNMSNILKSTVWSFMQTTC